VGASVQGCPYSVRPNHSAESEGTPPGIVASPLGTGSVMDTVGEFLRHGVSVNAPPYFPHLLGGLVTAWGQVSFSNLRLEHP